MFVRTICRPFVLVLLAALAVTAAGGCSWVGKTAGKTQAKVERKIDAVEQGYDKGYKEEKAKTPPQEPSNAQ